MYLKFVPIINKEIFLFKKNIFVLYKFKKKLWTNLKILMMNKNGMKLNQFRDGKYDDKTFDKQ